jgi:hypothetical protein
MAGWIKKIVGFVLVAVGALIAIAHFITRNDLPGCDSKRAKDTLSDIFKRNNVNASRYDQVKTLTKGDDEITCNATLTLADNKKLVIDYKLYRAPEGEMRLIITKSNP